MVICTVTCADYLYKALVMAKTAKTHMPDVKVYLCLVEKEIPSLLNENNLFDDIVLAKDIGIPNFEHFLFKHTIYEACIAVKGRYFKYLLDNLIQEDNFIFLDPDIMILDTFTEITEIFQSNSIILTPQINQPMETDEQVDDIELPHLLYGVFNLGFLGFKRHPEALKFIDWYTERLEYACYIDLSSGLFVDQKWVNLAPSFFEVYILKHPGYNVSSWNLPERKIGKFNGKYTSNGRNIKFYHFSGLGSFAEKREKFYISDRYNPFYEFKKQYINLLNEMGKNEYEQLPWSYEYYEDGEQITFSDRIPFRTNTTNADLIPNPYKRNNVKSNAIDISKENLINLINDQPFTNKLVIMADKNTIKVLKKSLLTKKQLKNLTLLPYNWNNLTSSLKNFDKHQIDTFIILSNQDTKEVQHFIKDNYRNLLEKISFINIID
ncbi:hypothetical protein [Bacillus sp. RO1]|uniref:hypothetical protein n=1 Tax=Bacillus sp. RO1 TaxID=2722703 RepID=UPI0014570DD7|nr:hypothetical protein [Bacillus sp. RO1]NLP50748.1 hypothetical protein [Bacillus sp. RO1]